MTEKIPQMSQPEKPLSQKKEKFSYWALTKEGASFAEISKRKKALAYIKEKGWESFEDFEIHGIEIESITKGSRERTDVWEEYSAAGFSTPKSVETVKGRIDLSGPIFGDKPQEYDWEAILYEESLGKLKYFTLDIGLTDKERHWKTSESAKELTAQLEKNIKNGGLNVDFPRAHSLGQAALRRALPEIFKEIKKYIWEKCYPLAAVDENVKDLEFKIDTEISQEIDQLTEEKIIEGLENRAFDESIFYQGEGADKFLEILRSQEYKLANTEMDLIKDHIDELAEEVGDKIIYDLGAGDAAKVKPLLQKQLESQDQIDYVPIDINPAFVFAAAAEIDNPQVNIQGEIMDFNQSLEDKLPDEPKTFTLLGNTLGNGDYKFQKSLLKNLSNSMTKDDTLLVGITLKKDLQETLANYDNEQGREFVMTTVRNLGFPEDKVELGMVADEANNQIKQIIHIKEDLTVKRGESEIEYKKGEEVTIFVSQKYEVDELDKLADSTDLQITKSFADKDQQVQVVVLQKK
ncbi:MAG: hypothetical protein GF365_05185 [Candidatus Buchananbacteria bacterium]|nr:hypothetical protein [Candidatus Buchananbacteria bacterium]